MYIPYDIRLHPVLRIVPPDGARGGQEVPDAQRERRLVGVM